MRLVVALVAVTIVVGAAGCEPGTVPAAPDAAIDARPHFEPPGSMTIRVRNDGTRNLYVQASGWSGQEVISVLKDGGMAVGSDTCELCNCETCPSCAVCGRSIARVAEIAPAGSLDFMWDQTDWSVIHEGCRPTLDCEEPMLVPPGQLTAQAVFSDTFTTTTEFGPEEQFIGTAIVATTVFQHPATDVVVVSIQ